MDLFGSSTTQFFNHARGGGAANNAVIHHHQPLAAEHAGERIELQLDAQVPDALVGFNKRSPYIAVSDQSLANRDAGLLGVTDAGAGCRIRYTHHEVGFHRVFLCQPRAHCLPRWREQPAVYYAIGAGKINILEDAQCLSTTPAGITFNTICVDFNDFTRLNLTDKAGTDVVKGACL